jgi:hypothetical protein
LRTFLSNISLLLGDWSEFGRAAGAIALAGEMVVRREEMSKGDMYES